MDWCGRWLRVACLGFTLSPAITAAQSPNEVPTGAAAADSAASDSAATGNGVILQAAYEVPQAASAQNADELATVLNHWSSVAQNIQTLQGRFTRYDYDVSESTEVRGQGRICFELEGRALYAVEPPPRTTALRSTRATQQGTPYQLQLAKAETLYWIQGQLARIDPVRQEYEVFEIPAPFLTAAPVEALESWDVIWTMLGCFQRQLPGLIEPDADLLRKRFDWTLMAYDADHIVVMGKPLTPAFKRHCSSLHVHLDARTYIPKATKLVDSTGTRETVHVFDDLRINQPRPSNTPDWAPDLGRLNLLTAPPLAPPAID